MNLNTKLQIASMLAKILDMNESEFDNYDINEDLAAVGLTSIKAISLIVLIEQRFNIVLEDGDLYFDKLNTITKIENVINKYK